MTYPSHRLIGLMSHLSIILSCMVASLLISLSDVPEPWGQTPKRLTPERTPERQRWSEVIINSKSDPVWQRIAREEPLTPYEWDTLALQLKRETSPLTTLAQLAAGLGWFRAGLYLRASKSLAQISSRDHPLAEVHLFFWAEALFHQGRYAESSDLFIELDTRYPGSLWAHRARFRSVDLLAQLGEPERALERLTELIERYPEYPYRASAHLSAADLALYVGQFERARSLLNEVSSSSLHAVSAVRARHLMQTLESTAGQALTDLTPKDRLKRALTWDKWKSYEIALRELRALKHDLPQSHKLWPRVALKELRVLQRSERFTEALTLNDELLKKLKKAHYKRSCWWWRSETLARLGRFDEAVQAFKRSRFNPRSAGSLARIGMIYFNGARYPEAEDAFKEATQRGEKGDPDLWMARRLLGWLPYRLGRYQEAARRFKRMSSNGRGSNHYAHYWWARSTQKLGRAEQALEIYTQLLKRAPYSFYAYLAQLRLEEVGERPKTPWSRSAGHVKAPQVAPTPRPLDALRPLAQRWGADLPLWEAIYGLALIGERSWARMYLRSLTEENRSYFRSSGSRRARWSFAPRFYLDNRDDSQYGIWGETQPTEAPRSRAWVRGLKSIRPTPLRLTLLDAYRALGDHYYARRVFYYDGDRLTYPEAPGEAAEWQRRYPRSFRHLVESSAARHSIDPHLIWALMTVESSHNPWAISRVGARGLMQVMPHTGQLTADRLGWPYFGPPLLFEPEVAIEMAAWYFKELITQFQGQLPLAMAGYNAGPHRVKIWLENKPALPLDELIEEIPYAQAREYAKKVTRHLGLYRRIYTGHTGHLFDLSLNPYVRGNINF